MLRARIAELEDENASLKDDLKAVCGLGAAIRQQRDQYRRERDELRTAIDLHILAHRAESEPA